MDPGDIIHEIIQIARREEAENLSEGTISLTNETLYQTAVDAFGGWDMALVHSLRVVLEEGRKKPETTRVVDEYEGVPEREPHPDALRDLIVTTSNGFLLGLPAESLASSPVVTEPQEPADFWEVFGQPTGLFDLADANAIISFSDQGYAFGWDSRIIPSVQAGDAARRLGARAGIERWSALCDRNNMRTPNVVISVSAKGKVKLSKVSTYPGTVTSEGIQAFLVDEGDHPIGVLFAEPGDSVMLFSSNGYGIHFPVKEIRPMGLKAVGVKGMQLRGKARVVGSLLFSQASQVALITAQGSGKRMETAEFRAQSRAGLGLVATKLQDSDRVAAVAPCEDAADLAVITSAGRILRLPAEAFPSMGRPAKGNVMVELGPDELVIGLARLLPMDFSVDSP